MGLIMIKISVVYLFLGTASGMFMSITHQFEFSSVHSHIVLLGWATMALAGLIYNTFPKMAKSLLGKAQFVLYNIGLPIMIISLLMENAGTEGMIPIISTGATITSLAILLFTINTLTGLKE